LSVESLSISATAEAIAAIDGTISARLEGNLAGLAAGSANGVIHLTAAAIAAAGALLARVAARLAALRLVGKALLSVKLLLTGSKNEFFAAILADECLVVVHPIPL